MDRRMSRWTIGIAALMIGWACWGPTGMVRAENCSGIADRISHGGILWTENAIVVQGTAAPNLSDPNMPLSLIKSMAQRAATLDAYRKAAGILAGVRITSDALAGDSPGVVTRIRTYVRQAEICKTKFFAGGGVDMVVRLPLNGAFATAVLSRAGTDVATAQSDYSGLVVDASDLLFVPALVPRLLSSDGAVLFSEEKVRKEVVLGKGAVSYGLSQKDIDQELVGSNPLRARAIGLGTVSPSDLVIDQKAADILAGARIFWVTERSLSLPAAIAGWSARI